MASYTNYFPILLLLTLLSFLHVHARDGQFFSKVSSANNNNNAKETTEVLPNEEEPLNKPEQEANLIRQNQNEGYGLYGHESGQLPSTTTTTTDNLPYKSENTEEPFNKENYHYNNDAYVTEPQGMSDTRFMEKGYTAYTTPTTTNNNNYYNGGNMYKNRQPGMGEPKFSTSNGNKYNVYNNKKQGMSDTRFLENGRYFYDLNSENYNLKANEKSRGFDSRNEYYNNRGHYGNNGNSFESRSEYHNNRGQYGNNENSYDEFNNSIEGYNQNPEEYQESQDDQFMP